MEEILMKNIFSDADIKKLSPDYIPLNIVMRMQVRRSLIKDTHTHGRRNISITNKKNTNRTLRNNIQSKNELTKLKQMFQSKNLNNDILIKNSRSIRYQNTQKNKAYTKPSNTMRRNEARMFNEKHTEVPEVENHSICEDIRVFDNNKLKTNGVLTRVNYSEDTALVEDLPINNFKTIDNEDINIDSMLENNKSDNLQSIIIKTVISSKNNNDSTQDISYNTHSEKQVIAGEKQVIADYEDFFTVKNISRKDTLNLTNENHDTVNVKEIKQHDLTISMPYNMSKSDSFLPVQKEPKLIDKTNKALINKYVTKWKTYTSEKREKRQQERELTIKNFLENLEKKKSVPDGENQFTKRVKLQAKDYTTYKHRYKVQQNIIALQKAKLEQQNRVIEELKYNKIVEASRNSVDELREELRKNYFEMDRNLRPRIKCLTNELNIPEVSETTLALQCLKVPQFLKQMEQRAREREEKHAIIRERRRQMEEERARIKQQAELEKAQMDKEEKNKIMKELREKRKKEKIESIRRKRNVEKMRALIVMADLHYERKIIVKYGMDPWKRLIQMKRENIEKAKHHYKFQLIKNVFLSWMWHTEDMWYDRNYRAEDFWRKKLLRKVFNGFKQNYYHFVLKKQVAEDYYELYLVQMAFRYFRRGVEQIKLENEKKLQKANAYYNGNLKFKVFVCWRSLPAINALQREQEARKARWRQRVLQVVPDYTPPDE